MDIGVDVGDRAMMQARSWRWLKARIVGLLTRPVHTGGEGAPNWPNRTTEAIYGPTVAAARRRAAAQAAQR